ncbi:hypothetical protein BH23CHL7_BH23CHL7_06230 [soil metagenome]
MNNRAGLSASHAHHDRLLVARHAIDDAYPGDSELARAQIERCPDCARLAEDIRTLSAATGGLGVPPRTRDFRITAEQAQRLRGSTFERFLRRLGGAGLAPARPLAGVALSVGLVLALVGAAMPASTVHFPGGDAVQFEMSSGAENQPMATSLPPSQPLPRAADDRSLSEFDVKTTDGDGVVTRAVDAAGRDAAADMREPLIYGGLGLALASLGALLLIVVIRRRLHDPLLR